MVRAIAEASAEVDPITQARVEVERLRADELALEQQRADKVAELAAVEQSAGAAVLEAHRAGGDTSALNRDVAELRVGIDLLGRAVAAARERRRVAIAEVWRAEAAQLRVRAAEKRAEADALQPEIDTALARLVELAGCHYAPVRSAGTALQGGQVGGSPDIVVQYIPRTDYWRQEAAQLEHQATQLEAREAPGNASIRGESTAELVDQVKAWDAMKLGPTGASVAAWGAEPEAAQRARLDRLQPHHVGYGGSVSLELTWRDGEIDTQRSRAGVPALDA